MVMGQKAQPSFEPIPEESQGVRYTVNDPVCGDALFADSFSVHANAWPNRIGKEPKCTLGILMGHDRFNAASVPSSPRYGKEGRLLTRQPHPRQYSIQLGCIQR
jgi:hypothetical protein